MIYRPGHDVKLPAFHPINQSIMKFNEFKPVYEDVSNYELISSVYALDPDQSFDDRSFDHNKINHIKAFTIKWSGGSLNHLWILCNSHHLDGGAGEIDLIFVGYWISQAIQPLHGYEDGEVQVIWDVKQYSDEASSISFESIEEAAEFINNGDYLKEI